MMDTATGTKASQEKTELGGTHGLACTPSVVHQEVGTQGTEYSTTRPHLGPAVPSDGRSEPPDS